MRMSEKVKAFCDGLRAKEIHMPITDNELREGEAASAWPGLYPVHFKARYDYDKTLCASCAAQRHEAGEIEITAEVSLEEPVLCSDCDAWLPSAYGED